MNTVSVLEEFYRSTIGPTMSEIYVNFNPVIGMIMSNGGMKGNFTREGEDIIFTQGGYYQGYSDARLKVGETGRSYDHKITKGRVTPEQATMRWEVETEMLVFEERDNGEKLADYLAIIADRWIKGWRDSHSIDLYEDGTGQLATIAVVGAPGDNDVKITEPQVFRKLPDGMHVHIGDEADFLAGNNADIELRTIVRQLDDDLFEVDNAATLVAGMNIKRELRRNSGTFSGAAQDKTYKRTYEGLKSNMATTGNLFGIDRSLVNFQPFVHEATAATGLVFDDIVDINEKALHRGLSCGDYFIPVNQYSTLIKRLTNDITTNTKSETFLNKDRSYNEGMTSIEFVAGNKMTRLFTDELLDKNKGYALSGKSWRAYVAANGVVAYDGGRPSIVNFGGDLTGKNLIYNANDPHSHAIEAVFLGQYACVDPKDNIVINFT